MCSCRGEAAGKTLIAACVPCEEAMENVSAASVSAAHKLLVTRVERLALKPSKDKLTANEPELSNTCSS